MSFKNMLKKTKSAEIEAAMQEDDFITNTPTQKDWINELTKSFILIVLLKSFTTKAGNPGWAPKTPPKYKQNGADRGNWVYIIVIAKGDFEYIMKIGGTGAAGGMASRISSYNSGRPNCNAKNGDVNRRIYERFVKYLADGWEVKFLAYECQTGKINVNMPWRTEEVSGSTQTFKIYEEDLIKLYEEKYGKKPIWNANTN
jgi:hypothetical protein